MNTKELEKIIKAMIDIRITIAQLEAIGLYIEPDSDDNANVSTCLYDSYSILDKLFYDMLKIKDVSDDVKDYTDETISSHAYRIIQNQNSGLALRLTEKDALSVILAFIETKQKT